MGNQPAIKPGPNLILLDAECLADWKIRQYNENEQNQIYLPDSVKWEDSITFIGTIKALNTRRTDLYQGQTILFSAYGSAPIDGQQHGDPGQYVLDDSDSVVIQDEARNTVLVPNILAEVVFESDPITP